MLHQAERIKKPPLAVIRDGALGFEMEQVENVYTSLSIINVEGIA